MTTPIFVDGLMVKPPHEKAPEFVKGKISIKREALIHWLEGQGGDWINLDIKVGKSGKWYAQVNEWVRPSEGEQPVPADETEVRLADIPF
jgi:hypothetical protein